MADNGDEKKPMKKLSQEDMDRMARSAAAHADGLDEEEDDDYDGDEAFMNPEDVDEEYDLDDLPAGSGPADDDDDDDGEGAEEEEDWEDLDEDEQGEDGRAREDVPAEQDDSCAAFRDHAGPVFSVAFHPGHPNVVVSGGGDDVANIWSYDPEAKTTTLVHKLEGHLDSVVSVSFSHDGKYVASAALDGTVRVYNPTTGELIQALEGPSGGIEWMQWHPKGAVLCAGGEDATTWMWGLPSGNCLNVFAGHAANVLCGTFTSDGKTLVTGSDDATLKVWNPKTAACTHTFSGDMYHKGPITCVDAHHSNSALIMSGSGDGTAAIVNIEQGRVLGVLRGHEDGVESVGFCKTHPWVATSSMDGKVNIWDLNSLQLRHTCLHDDGIVKISWHKSAPYIFSCGMDRTVRMWDARTGECAKVWAGHSNTVLDMDVSAAGDMIVTGSDDETAMVFKM